MGILDEKLVLTVEEARGILRLGKGSMYKAIKTGRIKCIRINGKILIPSAEIRRIINEASEQDLGAIALDVKT